MRVYFCICSISFALALVSSGAIAGAAGPTAACRSLASRFGTAAAQLDAKSLVTLGTCVAAELGERAAAAEPSAASPEAASPQPLPPTVVRPSPAPVDGSSSPPPLPYGEWPPSAPWIAHWPLTGPWERP
jgi:hypothetical protein